MSDKVKLPKEVAEGIDNARELGFTTADIIVKAFETKDHQGPYRNAIRDFAADNFDLFLAALVNGYEVIQTPEDKVREYYKTLERDTRSVKYHRDSEVDIQHHALTRAEMNGIEGTLERLNIKIEGVNI